MDTKEDILEQLREGLRNCDDYYKSDTMDSITCSITDTIDLSNLTCNITTSGISGGYTWLSPNASPNIYTTGTTGQWTVSDSVFAGPPSAKISLQGEEADIEVNGESLMTMIRGIQERLNILRPNPEMEQQWDELRELREAYESKLAECHEKNRVWKALKG